MINYDKWKLLNENFMSSQPLGIKKNNGFLAYNKLHEDEEIEDDDVEDMDDEDRENMDGEEDEYEDDEDEDMDGEEDEYEDEDMDGEEDEDEGIDDEGIDDEDEDEYEDDEYEDDEHGHEDEDDEHGHEDEGPMMGRVRSHHHSHDKHLSRPHHEMDTDEIDFAAKASDKMSRMYASCESMEYKMPSMNEWLSSVNGMMFPEELNDYIGKKGNVISEAKEEEEEEEDKAKLVSKLEMIKKRIDEAADSLNTIQQKQFVELLSYFINKLKPKVKVSTIGSGGISTKLKSLTLMLNDFLGIDNSEKSILDRTKPSMNSPKYMKKGCGKSMKMMPEKMKMMPKMSAKKSYKNCGYSSKNMKKSTKR